MVRTAKVTAEDLAGCSKRPSSKAASESKPEAYPLGYVEDFDEPRTQLAGFFSSLLADQHQAPSLQLTNDWRNDVAEGRLNDPVGMEGISPAARLG